jgi:hypothetical protein
LSLGAAYDYRANGLFNQSYENAVAGYLLWQATPKLKVNGRVDYATGSRGSDGLAPTPGAFGVPFDASTSGVRLLSGVGTLDYSLWANVISRLEFRWDHSLSGQHLFLQNGSRLNAFSLALNLIYKF